MTTDRIDAPPARAGSEAGFTLVEMMVAMAIMGIVVTAFLAILASVQRGLVRETNRSSTMDQVRLAMEAIDREVRSGSLVCVTSTGSNPYYTFTTYGPNAYLSTSNASWWIQYRVQSQLLQRREYRSSWGSWRTLASGIVNSTPTGTTTNVPFYPDTATQYTSTTGATRLLDVTLIVKSDTSDTSSSNVTLKSSIAIRNQDSSLSCSSVPAG
jgi:prepilin-type N-terminal cleavage/methylation domain-containing protein